LKDLGNKQFNDGNFKEAIDFFNQAIEIDPNNHVLYSNRSAAQLSVGNGQEALNDANKCVELNPTWLKGWGRKGASLHMLKKYDQSIEAFNKGLEIDQDSLYLKSGLDLVLKDKKQTNAPPNMNKMMEKLMGNTNINNKMSDPDFIKKIYEYQKNPLAMMQDKEMMDIFGNIMGEISTDNNNNNNNNEELVNMGDDTDDTDDDTDEDNTE